MRLRASFTRSSIGAFESRYTGFCAFIGSIIAIATAASTIILFIFSGFLVNMELLCMQI
jgi:hypothetical protein